MNGRCSLVVGWMLLLALCAVPAVGAADSGAESVAPPAGVQKLQPADRQQAQTTTADAITVTTTLDRTPETVGEMAVTVTVAIPDQVTSLTTSVPDRARVTRTSGFSQSGETTYEWDGQTAQPTVSYRVDPNRLADQEGPLSEDGQYLFADTEEWALVRIPHTEISGRYTGTSPVTLQRETTINGPGAAGDRMAFLGPVDVQTRRAHGQRFRLVIPSAADLKASPAELFASLSDASDRLRVGDRDSEVTMIAAPTGAVDWTVLGLQVGGADFWVQDSEGLGKPTNVWLHEYVHTRQDYEAATGSRWFTEGSATYYAAVLSLQQDRVDFDAFSRFLRQGERRPQSSSTLSKPDSWQNFAEYRKGALVAGELDRQIRRTTDREASLNTVFRELNTDTEPIGATRFRSAVRSAAGRDTADTATRYTTTSAGPSMWDETAHETAFGQSPARFSYRFADTAPLRVRGPSRNTSLSGSTLALVAGETLHVNLTVENVGGTVGDYELAFRVNETETTRTGRLRAGERTAESVTYTFSDPGEYTVGVGNEQFTVTVTPAEQSATDDASAIDTVDPPELTDTVEGTTNDSDEPAEGADTGEPNETVDESGVTAPGFGVVAALVALLLVAGGYRREN